jgi:hypothetical protein
MCEWFLEDVGEESTAGAVKLEVVMDGELDLGADMTTPMRETGDIRLEAEVKTGKLLFFFN